MIAYFNKNNNYFNSNNKQNQTITNIIALDGEGWNNSEGIHKYYILSAVDVNNKKRTLYTGRPLTTKECLDFLLSLSNNKEDLFISFAFTNYDVTKILENLTQEQLKILRANKEVTYDDYHIKHLKNKYFIVSRISSLTSFEKNGKTIQYYKEKITIYDVFSYYSCSFVKLCNQYGYLFKGKNIEIPKITEKDNIELTEVAENNNNEEEFIDFITSMKATRAEFKEENVKEIIEYCELENYILATIYKHTLNMCDSINITPSYHSGPGALAEQYLETQNISKYIKLTDSKVNNIAKSSYYGGRFETSIIGYAGDGYTYDINSAYPGIIINLPCLTCNKWSNVKTYNPNYKYGFYKVSVNPDLKSTWSPFPFKVTQSNRYDIHDLNLNVNQIFYPIGGTRWVTAEELHVAYNYFSKEELHVLDGYILDIKCDHTPFSNVINLYERRKQYKKEGNDSQIVIKLIINSLYGKLAQVVGKSKFTSWSWAAWITGHTRAQLADIALKYQNNILMLATDGIVSKIKLPELKVSDNLGDWEFDEVKDIYIFKPGLYVYTDKYGKQVTKIRGYQKSQLSAEYLLDMWTRGELIFPTEKSQVKFYTYAEAVQRIDFKDKLGQWTEEYKDINLNDTRRNVEKKDDNVITTTPWRINEGVGQYDDLGTKRINYDVKDKDNKLIGREVRLEYQTSDGIKKRIWQESYINNSWINNASNLKNMLYKLPEVMKVIRQQEKDNLYKIYVVEGCKNAYVLNKYLDVNKIKGVATTKLAGALNNTEAYEWIKDAKDVCFILDNDDAGLKHGNLAYEYLKKINEEINITFKKSKSEGSGDDIIDHLEAEYKLDELVDVDINEIIDIESKKYTSNDNPEENIEEITDKGIIFLNEWLEVNKEILQDIKKQSDKQYISLCPNHGDSNRSFMIGINNKCNLCVVIYCQTCGKDKFKQIVKHFTNGINNKECKRHNIREDISERLTSLEDINIDTITNENNINNKSSFPLHVFPGLIQLITETFAKIYLHEIDTVAPLMLSIFSMIYAGKFEGKFSDTWIEPLSKYLLISLPPSSNKTALIKALKKPFLDVEARLAEEYRKPINKAIALKKHYLNKAEKFSKLALKTDDTVAEEELLEKSYEYMDIADSIKLVKIPKTFIDNATEESLIKTLAENGGVISLLETENAFDGFTVYSSHPKLNILTKGYSGESVRYDRVTQECQIINRPTINIALLTQPANIKDIINIPGFIGKGLMSRFDVVVPPNNVGERKIYTPTDKDNEILDIYYKLVYELYYEFSKKEDITYVEYDSEAREIYEKLYEFMQKRIAPNGDLSYLAEWGGKRIGEGLRYGVLLHELNKLCMGILNNRGVNIMDYVVERKNKKDNNIERFNNKVNKKEATDAVEIVNWFATQIVKASSDVLQKDEDRDEDDINRDKARKLLEYLRKKEMKEFTARDLIRKLKRRFSDTEELKEVLNILINKKLLSIRKTLADNNKEVDIYFLIK